MHYGPFFSDHSVSFHSKDEAEIVVINAVNEILSSPSPASTISIIEYYAKKYPGDLTGYLKDLYTVFTEAKQLMNTIVYHPEKTTLRSPIAGNVFYLNSNAKGWQPFFIIGKNEINLEDIFFRFNEINTSYFSTGKNNLKQLEDEYLNEQGVFVAVRSKFRGPTRMPSVTFDVAVGQKVKANQIIGTITYFDFSMDGLFASNKRRIIEEYLESALAEYSKHKSLPKKYKFERKPKDFHDKAQLNLYDIWLGIDRQYQDLFLELAKPFNEFDNFGFIKLDGVETNSSKRENYKYFEQELNSHNTINDKKIVWIQEPKRGWQGYIAGLFFVLDKFSFIDKSSYSAYNIIDICKNTFSIDKLDNEPFNNMKKGLLNEKYTAEFEKRLRSLL